MKKQEFLKCQADDLVTHENKELLSDVLEWVEFALQFYPDTIEIDSKKTVEGVFAAIKGYATENKKQVISPKVATKIVLDYLEIKQPSTVAVSLDDFM